jgi:integrase
MKRRRQFPGATPYTDRHGRRRWRFRKGAFSAELGTDYGSDEFRARYEAAVEGERRRGLIGAERTLPGSLSALIACYYRSAAFLALESGTRANYRSIIELMREKHGEKPVAMLKRRHVLALMAEKAETPSAANNRLKRLRQLLDHALDLEWIEANPAREVKPMATPKGGFHTWTEGEIARFLGVHQPGTLAHRAMTLMLYTGAARSDAVRLGWGNLSDDGRLTYRRGKTLKRSGAAVNIPVHPVLAELLATLPRDAFTFLQTRDRKSRSGAGLGNLMRRWCDAAGLPLCTSHGLRKAITVRLFEAGATSAEVIAVTGHGSVAEVEPYSRAINRAGLADAAMAKMDRAEPQSKLANLPTRFAKEPRNRKSHKED